MKKMKANHRAHRDINRKNIFFSNEKKPSLCSPREFHLKDITERIISCAIEVHSTLGPGLLENVYEEALSCEFTLRGIKYDRFRVRINRE